MDYITMDETQLFAEMERLRERLAQLARQLPDQGKTGVSHLHDDLYRLRGRFMQCATAQEWQRVNP